VHTSNQRQSVPDDKTRLVRLATRRLRERRFEVHPIGCHRYQITRGSASWDCPSEHELIAFAFEVECVTKQALTPRSDTASRHPTDAVIEAASDACRAHQRWREDPSPKTEAVMNLGAIRLEMKLEELLAKHAVPSTGWGADNSRPAP